MFGMETLDVFIGLVTVYLVFGLACTAIVETISALLSTRSNNLESALSEFFAGDLSGSQKFLDAFYAHPLVQTLSKGADGRPSYIPPAVVSQVVEALITANGTVTTLDAALQALPGNESTNRIKGVLGTFVRQAKGDVAAFRSALETHFNATMDRASGWFKRRAQAVGLAVSLLLVLSANVDSVQLASALSASNAGRIQLVDVAAQKLQQAKANQTKQPDSPDLGKQSRAAQQTYNDAVAALQAAGLPFGWTGFHLDNDIRVLLMKIAGLLVSVFAVSLGAPFWFDVLQRFMQVRAAGASPKETKEAAK